MTETQRAAIRTRIERLTACSGPTTDWGPMVRDAVALLAALEAAERERDRLKTALRSVSWLAEVEERKQDPTGYEGLVRACREDGAEIREALALAADRT